jgi:fluoroquinolone transport system permease protein
MRWDFIHLLRNQLITISIILALVYFGIFYLIKGLGNVDNFLVLIIYNDPVITGYVFAAVLLLFERNQNTLQALSVTPIRLSQYLWSKAIVLSILAWVVALAMMVATHGWGFQFIHFTAGVCLATLLSVFCGFILTAGCTSLNTLIARSVPFFVIFALPFLGIFRIVETPLWYAIPSYPGALLVKAAVSGLPLGDIIYGYLFGAAAVIVSYFLALSQIKKNLSR